MPREIALFDALVPTLLFVFLFSVSMALVLDWLLARYGLYRYIWYRALFRLALFVCLFAGCGLVVFGKGWA